MRAPTLGLGVGVVVGAAVGGAGVALGAGVVLGAGVEVGEGVEVGGDGAGAGGDGSGLRVCAHAAQAQTAAVHWQEAGDQVRSQTCNALWQHQAVMFVICTCSSSATGGFHFCVASHWSLAHHHHHIARRLRLRHATVGVDGLRGSCSAGHQHTVAVHASSVVVRACLHAGAAALRCVSLSYIISSDTWWQHRKQGHTVSVIVLRSATTRT